MKAVDCREDGVAHSVVGASCIRVRVTHSVVGVSCCSMNSSSCSVLLYDSGGCTAGISVTSRVTISSTCATRPLSHTAR